MASQLVFEPEDGEGDDVGEEDNIEEGGNVSVTVNGGEGDTVSEGGNIGDTAFAGMFPQHTKLFPLGQTGSSDGL